MSDTKASVLQIIQKVMPDTDIATLGETDDFRGKLDLDSMDFLSMLLEIKKKFSIEIPAEVYPKLNNLKNCVDFIEDKIKK